MPYSLTLYCEASALKVGSPQRLCGFHHRQHSATGTTTSIKGLDRAQGTLNPVRNPEALLKLLLT